MIRAIVISVIVAVPFCYGLPDLEQWLGLPMMTRWLCYPFVHANLFHLAVNCLAVWVVFSPKRRDNVSALLAGAVISFLVYPFALRPCIGISNLLYGVMGYRSPSLKDRWWRSAPAITFLAVTAAMCFIPQISGVTHVFAFAAGVGVAAIRRTFKSPEYDTERYLR